MIYINLNIKNMDASNVLSKSTLVKRLLQNYINALMAIKKRIRSYQPSSFSDF
jgi:hypothetical protein